MSDNPKLRKNGGKGTFFGNLWRSVVKNNIPLGDTIVSAIDSGNPAKVIDAVMKDDVLDKNQKEILLNEAQNEIKKLEMEAEDRNSARDMYAKTDNETANFIAKRVINWNLFVVVIAILIEIAAVIYISDKVLIAIVSSAVGAFTTALLQERQQVINFFFGSSLGSKKKTDQLNQK